MNAHAIQKLDNPFRQMSLSQAQAPKSLLTLTATTQIISWMWLLLVFGHPIPQYETLIYIIPPLQLRLYAIRIRINI